MALKNRLVMPALHHLYTPDGYATDRFNQYYWRRAEGASPSSSSAAVPSTIAGRRSMVRLSDDSFIPGYREFTDGCHARGAKVAASSITPVRTPAPLPAGTERCPLRRPRFIPAFPGDPKK
jgi:2,4-dienoyl-CoA reductase (NADPH2)